jgi:serine/threonine protein kinase
MRPHELLPDELTGHTIDGRYRLEAPIGKGGVGTVYRAARLLIGDHVAIKVLHGNQVSALHEAERFQREAQAAARLKHPNAVSIYDFGISTDGLQYLVMELVEGQSLRQMIKSQGSFSPSSAAEIIAQVASALDEAHRQNIIHRDVKPDNIIINSTHIGLRVKVLDFGIAKLRDQAESNLTQTGSVVGTPHYMSPEQCMGEEIDSRSDIYSLGIVLYEMLCGVVPFNSPASTAVVVQHVTQPPPSLRAINPHVPPAIEAVVLHALEKRREDRPQTADELSKELIAATDGLASTHQASAQTGLNISATGDTPELMATVALKKTHPTAPRSVITGSAATINPLTDAVQRPSNTARTVGFTVLATVLLLSLGGIGVWVFLKGPNDGAKQRDQTNPAVSSQMSVLPSPSPDRVTGNSKSSTPYEATTAVQPSPSLTTADTTLTDRQIPSGNWYVVLGSYPKSERVKADARLGFIRHNGYDAYLVDTDNNPTFRSGLWAVVMGPYQKGYAKNIVNKLRPVIPDAYVK